MKPSDGRLPERMGASLLGLLVVGLPIWRGGVPPWAYAGALVLATLSLALLSRRSASIPATGAGLLLVCGVVVVQLTPLPPWAHAAFPAARSLFDAILGPLGRYPATRPISLDPPETAKEFAAAAACAAAFWSAWLAGTSRRGRRIVLGSLAAAGVAVSVVILGRALLGWSPLLVPRGPFVNANHLAGFSALASLTTLGLALRARGEKRLPLLLGFAASALPVFLSLSRGGIAAFLAGLAVFLFLQGRSDHAEGGWGPRLGPVAWSVVLLTLSIAGWLALKPLLAEVARTATGGGEEKTFLWAGGVAVLKDFPWLGVGRGAFPSAFAAYRTDTAPFTFTHLENEWLQSLVDLGLPGGLLLISTFLLTWLRAARRRPLSATDAGLLAGAAAVAIQNFVDFSLHIPGVAIPFSVAMGLACRGAGSLRGPRWLGLAVSACLLASGGLALRYWSPRATEMEVSQVAAVEDPDAAVAAAARAASHHPADYLPHLAAGSRLAESGRCAEAMAWLGRAMLLSPTAPEAHLIAARCLAASGQDAFARREFRLAISFGSAEAFREGLRTYPRLEDLYDIVPGTAPSLMALGDVLSKTSPAESAAVYRRVLEEFGDPLALVPLASSLLRAGKADEAYQLAKRRQLAASGDDAAWLVAAQALLQLDRDEDAVAEAKNGLLASAGSLPLIRFLVEESVRAHRLGEAKQLAEGVLPRNQAELSAKHLLVASVLHQQGRELEALERARLALAVQPDVPDHLFAVATYAEAAGSFDEALKALERIAFLTGRDADFYKDRMTRLRASAAAAREHTQGDAGAR